jgi:hypothetical protein
MEKEQVEKEWNKKWKNENERNNLHHEYTRTVFKQSVI